jgi:hypothetical protein
VWVTGNMFDDWSMNFLPRSIAHNLFIESQIFSGDKCNEIFVKMPPLDSG